MQYLTRLWDAVNAKSKDIEAGKVVHKDLPLYLRVLRDMVDEGLEKIRVDSRETYAIMGELPVPMYPKWLI